LAPYSVKRGIGVITGTRNLIQADPLLFIKRFPKQMSSFFLLGPQTLFSSFDFITVIVNDGIPKVKSNGISHSGNGLCRLSSFATLFNLVFIGKVYLFVQVDRPKMHWYCGSSVMPSRVAADW